MNKKYNLEINEFFRDGNLKEELITDTGENNVKELVEFIREKEEIFNERKRKKETVNDPIEINQARKFYDDFVKVYNSKMTVEEKKIQLLMLKAQVEYAVKRLKIKRFSEFLNNRINIILKKSGEEFNKNLEAFKLHFEALIAYFPKK